MHGLHLLALAPAELTADAHELRLALERRGWSAKALQIR